MPHVITYGSPDEELMREAARNFAGATFSRPSFCTTPVELLSNDGLESVIGHGTGFFWQEGGTDYVVTNWHVLSGRNPFTEEIMSPHGFVPERVRVHGWRLSGQNGRLVIGRRAFVLNFGPDGAAAFSTPLRVAGRVLDIVAIPLPADMVWHADLRSPELEEFRDVQPRINLMTQDLIDTEAGDDCVILGYPLKHYTGLMLPLWKKGSLATESNMAVDSSPAFLVDCATSSAMSGAPILRRVAGPVSVDPATERLRQRAGHQLVGIYAGRLQSQELDRINVGYGWFASQIAPAVLASRERWAELLNARAADLARPTP